MRTDEVADALGASAAVVRIRLSRARGPLRGDLIEPAGLAASNTFPFPLPRCDRSVRAVLARLQ